MPVHELYPFPDSDIIRELSRLGARVIVFMPESGLDIHDARAQLTADLQGGKFRDDPATGTPFSRSTAGDHQYGTGDPCKELALWSSGEGEFRMRLEKPFPGWGDIGLSVDPLRLGCTEEILARYRIHYT